MHAQRIFIALPLIVLLWPFASASAQQNESASSPAVVVELFTSQGCSSCPPADAVLRQIDRVAQAGKHPVYALSFHVDYWNRLGWKDPYSDSAYSRRQSSYAAHAGSTRVYTPQMVVNGRHEFNGSNKAKAHAAISSELKLPSEGPIDVQRDRASDPKLVSLKYQVGASQRRRLLNVAVVNTPAANQVTQGENRGRELSHVNVVRAFRTVSLTEDQGTVELDVPADLDLAGAKAVVYLQDAETLAITAGVALAL